MLTDEFDYILPPERIARYPLDKRSESRMLHLRRPQGEVVHRQVNDLPQLLEPRDLLVFNNTRVLPARLYARRPTGGQVEILLERIQSATLCIAQLRASRKPGIGEVLLVDGEPRLRMKGREGAFFILESVEGRLQSLFEDHGHMPLPPYLERADDASDMERYQTVFADEPGAVAAPTAGLHFDDELLQLIDARGIQRGCLTLHVGAGTFQPVRSENIEEHQMHAEWASVSAALIEQIRATQAAGGRVIAIGTTVVRALESAAAAGLPAEGWEGETAIFIYPGYQFQVVDALFTNFHLPRSTLLMLVSAFAGREAIMDAYQSAIASEYRFFSYGDAMFIDGSPPGSDKEGIHP